MCDKKITVIQGNDLLESAYSLSIDAMRLLNLALSKIDTEQTKPNDPYIITIDDFKGAYEVDVTNAHTRLKNAANALMSNPITIYSKHPKKDAVITDKYSWFARIRYDSSEHSGVLVEFSHYVAPYLYELVKKGYFTSMKFCQLAQLDTPFSIRLYSWLCKARKLNKHKQGDVVTVELVIDWMKERAGLLGKYNDVRKFQAKVIKPAIERINSNTDLSVIYEPIKQGKTITAFKFSYVEERLEDKTDIVTRSRLPRRPPSATASHLEGEWARECIKILLQYEKDLSTIKSEKLPRDDAKKLLRYAGITGDNFLIADVKKRYKL